MATLIFISFVVFVAIWAMCKAAGDADQRIFVENWKQGGGKSENKRLREAAQDLRR